MTGCKTSGRWKWMTLQSAASNVSMNVFGYYFCRSRIQSNPVVAVSSGVVGWPWCDTDCYTVGRGIRRVPDHWSRWVSKALGEAKEEAQHELWQAEQGTSLLLREEYPDKDSREEILLSAGLRCLVGGGLHTAQECPDVLLCLVTSACRGFCALHGEHEPIWPNTELKDSTRVWKSSYASWIVRGMSSGTCPQQPTLYV